MRNTTFFMKGTDIITVELRKNQKDIRVYHVGPQPISLSFYTEEEADELMKGLLDCMKGDVPGIIEREFELMKAKEVVMRMKIDTMKEQLGELRGLLEEIAANTQSPVARKLEYEDEDEREQEEVEKESLVGPKDLTDYETLSECEDEKGAEAARFGEAVVLFVTMVLMFIFLTGLYMYTDRPRF